MAEVDWITWKTEPEELLHLDSVLEKMDSFFEDYYSYMKPVVYEQLKNEILRGGLSKDSFHVLGKSPSNESALQIIELMDDINQNYLNLKNNVRDSVSEQEEIEKNQLIHVIEDRISDEIQVVQNGNFDASLNTYYDLLTARDRVRKLEEKLEKIQTL